MNEEMRTTRTITNEDFDKQIWLEDFHRKGERIGSHYEQSTAEALYIALTGGLDQPCFLNIEELPKRRVQKVNSFYDTLPFLDQYHKVLIYPKEFNKPSCVQMRFMEYINAFVIDLDDIRSYNIDVALRKIDHCPIKPNFIVNSGNGLHLYFILKEKFEFLDYTKAVSFARGVRRIKIEGKKVKRHVVATADKIKDVYAEMLKWYEAPNCYKTDKLHLAHGIRMFGGKTKNALVLSTVYKGYEEQYDLEAIAEMVGVELLTEHERNRLCGEIEAPSDFSEADAEPSVSEQEDHAAVAPAVYELKPAVRVDYTLLGEKLKQFVEDHKHELMPKRLVPKWKQYNYLVSAIKEYNYLGIRNKCLFIMACQGKLYQIPEHVVRKDLEEMAVLMNEITPDDPITQANIEKAFDGYFSRYSYSNPKITEITGIPFGKTQKQIRMENREARDDEHKRMLALIDEYFAQNGLLSLRKLNGMLKSNGIERSKTFLSTDPDVVAIRNKYMR